MKKVILLFFCLSTAFLFAQDLQTPQKQPGSDYPPVENSNSLCSTIKAIEMNKKQLLTLHDKIIKTKETKIQNAVKMILQKENEIYTSPYRLAELDKDGITPSPFALERRKNNFIKSKDSIINSTELSINETIKQDSERSNKLLQDINNKYASLSIITITSKNPELIISCKAYDGSKFGWYFNILLQNDYVKINNSAFLSFQELTGKDPELYSKEDFDGFCDLVDFYDNLFKTEIENYDFTLSCSAIPADIKFPSQYTICFNNLIWKNKDKEIPFTIINNEITYKQPVPYSLKPLFTTALSIKESINMELDNYQLEKEGFSSNYKLLPEGTDGTMGTDVRYVLFGFWPQSVKDDNVLITEKESKKIYGWDCYKGSDNNYYVKQKANTYNNYYMHFNNGERVIDNSDYYFQLEPIKWSIIENQNDDCLLLAENILISCEYSNQVDDSGYYAVPIDRTIYNQTISPNNYEFSEIRAYLNGLDGTAYQVKDYTNAGFINMAFSKKSFFKLNTITVDNSKESTVDYMNIIPEQYQLPSNNTEDKVFLLSVYEISNKNNNFKQYNSTCNNRKRKQTDFFLVNNDLENWWLRTPYYDSFIKARSVDSNGKASHLTNANIKAGVVPAINISISELSSDNY